LKPEELAAVDGFGSWSYRKFKITDYINDL
jgi:hypothetical protein